MISQIAWAWLSCVDGVLAGEVSNPPLLMCYALQYLGLIINNDFVKAFSLSRLMWDDSNFGPGAA